MNLLPRRAAPARPCTVLAALLALAACGPDAAPSAPEPARGLRDDLFATTPPAGARPLSEARRSAKAGQDVVLEGRIGGRQQPFVEGRAMFTLVSSELKACDENPGDDCSTPWDYCCESKESLLAHTATVRVVDAKGEIVGTSLLGTRGLKPGARVVVAGRVHATENGLIVDARELFVAPEPRRGG
jgi:hypothetical protein